MILYFSGTGNSAHLAKRIEAALGDDLVNLNEVIKDSKRVELSREQRLKFVLPTYAWRIPRIVERWMRRLPMRGKDAYFIMNCGDGIGNAGAYLQGLCHDLGLRYMGVAGIVMPENYIAVFDCPSENEAKRIVRDADRALLPLIDHMSNGSMLPQRKPSLLDKLYSSCVNPLFYRFIISDKPFYAKDSCIGCGKCALACPTNNITLIENKPAWHHRCTHCMACICPCPVEAIEYGKRSAKKRRYHCPTDAELSAGSEE